MGCAHLHWANRENEKGDWHAQQAEQLCQQYGMQRLVLLGRVPQVASQANLST